MLNLRHRNKETINLPGHLRQPPLANTAPQAGASALLTILSLTALRAGSHRPRSGFLTYSYRFSMTWVLGKAGGRGLGGGRPGFPRDGATAARKAHLGDFDIRRRRWEPGPPSPGGGGSARIARCETGWGGVVRYAADEQSPHPDHTRRCRASPGVVDPPPPGEGEETLALS
jgi:hypothetical protein